MKTQKNIESRCYRTGKYTVCRRIRAFFSPDILQAVAVKGLSKFLWRVPMECKQAPSNAMEIGS